MSSRTTSLSSRPASLPAESVMPFSDLKRLHAPLLPALLEAAERVMSSGVYVLGAEVAAFEREFAEYCETSHAVGVSSGTAALSAALRGLGIGHGGPRAGEATEVIAPAFSYIASASTAFALGARVVFCDIEPTGFGLDPRAVRSAITPRTRAVVAVHLFGRMCEVQSLEAICGGAGVALIEDAAQAVGARDAAGRRAGSIGAAGCHSFFPAKNFGAFGDGGAVTTSDASLADRITVLRQHAARPKYHHEEIGGNWRLDALQAALLRVKLPHLHNWTADRQQAAQWYRQAVQAAALDGWLLLPHEGDGIHVYNQFVVRVPSRDAVRAELAALGVPTMVYYPEPLAMQPCFASLGVRAGQFPEAERASQQVLALPIFPGITEGEIERVVAALRLARDRIAGSAHGRLN